MMAEDSAVPGDAPVEPSRRRALARLGLAATVAYAAPVITTLDRAAAAFDLPSCKAPPPLPGDPCDPALTGGEPIPFEE